MNMIAPVEVLDKQSNHFSKLRKLIAEIGLPREAAYLEARILLSAATAKTCPHDNLYGARDAFLAQFKMMAHLAEIHGLDNSSLSNLKNKCNYYLDQVEAMTDPH